MSTGLLPDWPSTDAAAGDQDAEPIQILIPHNGSPSAVAALDAVSDLARGRPVTVWVLYVRSWDVNRGGTRVCLETAEESRRCVQTAVDSLRERKVSASGIVRNARRERVAHVIVDEAERLDVSCIAMGTHAHSRVISALTGSVSRRVARRATRRIILVDATSVVARDQHGCESSATRRRWTYENR